MPSFRDDLQQEKYLAKYLDSVYDHLGFHFRRVPDLDLQHQGVDIILNYGSQSFNIDEKAQLHYINKDIPTFTFELSYLKNGELKKGWLFDEKKATEYYFLITAIYLKDTQQNFSLVENIAKVKITSVNRKKLINLLETKNLSSIALLNYDYALRENQSFGNNYLEEIDHKSEGCIYFTRHLVEQPLNLKLNLKFLIQQGVAKRIFEN